MVAGETTIMARLADRDARVIKLFNAVAE